MTKQDAATSFPHQPALHNVTNAHCDIARLAMQKVIVAGYRRIGFVMHRGWDHAVDHLWAAGYLCEQQALTTRDRRPMHLFPEPEVFKAWFRKYRPEAVISKASFVLPILRNMGRRSPRCSSAPARVRRSTTCRPA